MITDAGLTRTGTNDGRSAEIFATRRRRFWSPPCRTAEEWAEKYRWATFDDGDSEPPHPTT